MTYTKLDRDHTSIKIDVDSSSIQSPAITTGSGRVRLAVTTDTHIEFGANPTATVNSLLLPINTVEVFEFRSGEKIACIRHASTNGKLCITPVD
ncbi:hypothetical protein [Planktomarina sp.]|jgi:hypothetical protein|uniref:hypothetical protein n=1 Tax=Planktomarina sp. TaxID=2024851 RepID=UPI003261CB5A